jgi:hypothetical protein
MLDEPIAHFARGLSIDVKLATHLRVRKAFRASQYDPHAMLLAALCDGGRLPRALRRQRSDPGRRRGPLRMMDGMPLNAASAI